MLPIMTGDSISTHNSMGPVCEYQWCDITVLLSVLDCVTTTFLWRSTVPFAIPKPNFTVRYIIVTLKDVWSHVFLL